ncbi:unnamed protein product [Amoebophrya sp. A120]|nr:unnamed protein product [Amoebophrya sp. A120]|eukprot:GSA120T00018572001.1
MPFRSGPVRGNEVAQWSCVDVAEWLRSLELPQHALAFQEVGIDGPTLLQLTQQDIKEQFEGLVPGLQGWIASKKIAGHINIFKLHLGQESSLAELEMSAISSLRGRSPVPPVNTRPRPATADEIKKASHSTTASSNNNAVSSGSGSARSMHTRRSSRPRTANAASLSQLSMDPVDTSDVMLHTQRSQSFLTEQMSTFDLRRRSHKGTMSQAKRNVSEGLYLRGAASPGVCRYDVHIPDAKSRRGGVMSRAPRFEQKRPHLVHAERPPPGPQSYVPNFLAKSRAVR